MKNLFSGTQCGGFQLLLILDLWGISFHAVVVFGLGKNLLFKSILGRCVVSFRTFRRPLFNKQESGIDFFFYIRYTGVALVTYFLFSMFLFTTGFAMSNCLQTLSLKAVHFDMVDYMIYIFTYFLELLDT